MTCRTLYSVTELRASLDQERRRGNGVAVVLTMGALHEGHLSLVREAARLAPIVVVSVFVNPTQFGPGEDFERYPRDLERDAELAAGAGATIVFSPSALEMYPPGEQARVSVEPLSQGLCGESRPGHFVGVATVVSKFFNVIGPGVYLFGKKDYQQWRIIERLARDLLFPVEVRGLPTVREEDGLAMSSRNAYLSPSERRLALRVPHALAAALDAYRAGARESGALRDIARSHLENDLEIDYVETRHPETLEAVEGTFDGDLLLAVAVRLGKTRLIDNVVLSESAPNLLGAAPP